MKIEGIDEPFAKVSPDMFLNLCTYFFYGAGCHVECFTAELKDLEKTKIYGLMVTANDTKAEFDFILDSRKEQKLWLKLWDDKYQEMAKNITKKLLEECDIQQH